MKFTTMDTLKVLLIIALFYETQSQERCRTYTDSVFCSGFTLEAGKHLEIHNPNNKIIYIALFDCSISSIPSGFFSNFTNATSISMNHVGASAIEPDAFHGMSNLKSLELSGNDIPEIHADMFMDLVSLEELHLKFNNLIEIKPETFNSLTKLKYLDLSYNDIVTIHPESFKKLSELVRLDLSWNKIKTFPDKEFYTLIKLQTLSVNNNKIISWLDPENLLTRLPNFANISLNSNNWQCNSLQNIMDVFKYHNVKVLDNYTKYETNVNGIACKENLKKLDMGSTENILQKQNTKLDTNVDKQINHGIHLPYDITHILEKFEKEYKNHSTKLTIINTVVIVVSLFVIILLVALFMLYLYRRKKLYLSKSVSVRYNDVGLMSDCLD